MPQIPCEAVVIIDQNEQDIALLSAGYGGGALYRFFIYIIFLQGFAQAAKLAMIGIKASQ
jgi:hypothetical protein